MKTFILSVSKNKKWITLGLSILYLLLFCFPLVTFSKGYFEDASEASYFRLPFILSLPYDWMRFPAAIKTTELSSTEHKAYVTLYIAQNITCSILVFICLVLAIICIIRQFKGKKFCFLPSLALAFLTMLVAGIYTSYHSSQGVEEIKYHLNFYPTTYIFLVLLILDVVYLVLEKHYKVKELIKPIATEDNSKSVN